eukprot:3637249-Lingulodinium_polyedra.AAC.1
MSTAKSCSHGDEPHATRQRAKGTGLTRLRAAAGQSIVHRASAGEILRPPVPSTADQPRIS